MKGFDFAKLHLGQQSKDDVMVIQEQDPDAGPLSLSVKDGLSPSKNGEVPTPGSKNSSSTKASRSGRRRERSVLPVVPGRRGTPHDRVLIDKKIKMHEVRSIKCNLLILYYYNHQYTGVYVQQEIIFLSILY